MYPPVSLVRIPGGRLFRKHLALTASAMAPLLAVSSAIDIWWSYRDQEALLIRIQRVHADAAAARIADFVRGIEAQLNWMTHRAWSGSSPELRQLEALRLLRQVPPISELALIDDSGREQVKVSREIRIGSRGVAFVVDADGRLIAHPDMSLVLRVPDLSPLPHVHAVRSAGAGEPLAATARSSLMGEPVMSNSFGYRTTRLARICRGAACRSVRTDHRLPLALFSPPGGSGSSRPSA